VPTVQEDIGVSVAENLERAKALLAERYGSAQIGDADADGVLRVAGVAPNGEVRARWLLRSDGSLKGAWDPDRLLDEFHPKRLVLRVFTYRRGARICPLCGDSLQGFRRDAVAHPNCGRELRRKRAEGQNGSGGRRAYANSTEGGTGAAEVALTCPACGGHVFTFLHRGVGVSTGQLRQDVPVFLGSRKGLTCIGCEWRGTVAKARG
jgi:hypothetical protein